MGTDILKSLQSELDLAKNSLKGVDENIKRLIGREPWDYPPTRAAGPKRSLPEDKSRTKFGRNRENNEPATTRKRNISSSSSFKRVPEKYYEEEIQPPKQMISKVIVTSKEPPSRQEALAAQSKDEQSKARNRRMFGALLGTLQKFQQEETKLKLKEDKRAKVEKKIEEHEIKEREEIKKEKQVLFLNRKRKQAEIKMIELKMLRMKEFAAWEESQKSKMNFIQTKANPHVFYLPRRHNDVTKTLLDTSRDDIKKIIEKRRQEVFIELQRIEERMKRNFELRGNDVHDEEMQEEKEDECTNGEQITSLEDQNENGDEKPMEYEEEEEDDEEDDEISKDLQKDVDKDVWKHSTEENNKETPDNFEKSIQSVELYKEEEEEGEYDLLEKNVNV